MYRLVLQRVLTNRISDAKVQKQIDHILARAVGGTRGRTWTSEAVNSEPVRSDAGWVFRTELRFVKRRGDRGSVAEYRQWEAIKAMVQQAGSATKYQNAPWIVVEAHEAVPATPDGAAPADTPADIVTVEPEGFDGIVRGITDVITRIGGVREIQPLGTALTWEQLHVPDELLGPDSDRRLAEHPAWKNLYGVNPQIRLVLSNIRRAQQTGGESRNHAVLFGHAGCGKTTTMFALEQMFGPNSVLKLDATSTTRAGLEKLFFTDLPNIPPLVFMEEAEKADPEALKIWLGALDDRGEIRKVNFRVNQLRSVKVLFICTVNNKGLFDRMMGSDGSQAGALSSRCVTQVYYPRPSDAILLQILEKEVRDKGGRHEWIAPAVALARELRVTDPRVVRSYLAGGDRLLDGTYQRDWLAINAAQEAFNKG